MKWRAPIEHPKEGDLKVVTKYAWLPTQVGEYKIWLQQYQELYEWVVRERALPYFNGMSKVFYHTCGDWDLKDTKILSNV